MEKKKNVSMAVIKRMPKYYRYLGELVKNDVDRISSKELGEKIGFTASQIRQDLNNFGGFGHIAKLSQDKPMKKTCRILRNIMDITAMIRRNHIRAFWIH